MRCALVQLDDGRRVWVRCGSLEPGALDAVTVRVGDAVASGRIVVAPDALVRPPETVEGVVIDVGAEQTEAGEDEDFPGADMPPLGAGVRTPAGRGCVTGIDPVKRRVAVMMEDGSRWEGDVEAVRE